MTFNNAYLDIGWETRVPTLWKALRRQLPSAAAAAAEGRKGNDDFTLPTTPGPGPAPALIT